MTLILGEMNEPVERDERSLAVRDFVEPQLMKSRKRVRRRLSLPAATRARADSDQSTSYRGPRE